MIAVLDACVLYPPSLRDMLMWLAVVKVYEPRWTEEIHTEWIRSVLADRPDVTAAQLERTRRLMDRISPDCLVNGYEPHIGALSLPDANDRHVLAAAIQCRASVIVTFNLTDFPKKALAPHNIRALHPDAFFEALYTGNQARFLRGLHQHRASLKDPPKSPAEYLATMQKQGLRKMALRLQTLSDKI